MTADSNSETGSDLVAVKFPQPYRCGISFTFDTDMANGYSPPDNPGCHGRTAGFVSDKMQAIMDVAERFDVRLHWFKIANGLEDDCDYRVYAEALERGHDVDSHSYNHISLADSEPGVLNKDLCHANELLKKKLKVEPVILRGPYGYGRGKFPAANRKVVLDNGFKYVSGEFNGSFDTLRPPSEAINDSDDYPPHRYPDGLIEIPVHGYTDREFFDFSPTDPDEFLKWRHEFGHKPVPADWKCPWTEEDALDKFIEYHKKGIDVAYENRMFYCFCSHPYSFYLHDRDNRVLEEIISHIRSKDEAVWIGTLRDFALNL